MRGLVAKQICPFCRRGGWRNLGLHTFYSHGVTASELRSLLEVPHDHHIASPDFIEQKREEFAGRASAGSARDERAREARDALRAAWQATSGDAAALTQLAIEIGVEEKSLRQRLHDLGITAPAFRQPSRHAFTGARLDELRRLYSAGVPQHELAERYGVSRSTIWRYLRATS